MSVGVLLMTHESVGKALISAALHVMPKLPLKVPLSEIFDGSSPTLLNNTKSFIGHAMGAAGALEKAD